MVAVGSVIDRHGLEIDSGHLTIVRYCYINYYFTFVIALNSCRHVA